MKFTLLNLTRKFIAGVALILLIYIVQNIFREVKDLWFENDEQILSFNESNDVIIELKYGRIRGSSVNESGLEFHQFLGIPYAKIPVDEVKICMNYTNVSLFRTIFLLVEIQKA